MIKLSDFEGGGGVFVPTGGMISDELTAGQTGLLISAPEVDNTVYKLQALLCDANATQAGISLIIDNVTIEDESILLDTSPTTGPAGGRFLISDSYGSTTAAAVRLYRNIICSSFSVVKNTGNTTQNIDIIYQVGELK
jgi:hypothetical protein